MKRRTPPWPPPPASGPATSPRLDAETKQITHAIRLAAFNSEITLARALHGRYARTGDEACALTREALTTSGDIQPGPEQLLVRLDPLTAPRRTQAPAALCHQLSTARTRYPGTNLVLRYQVKPHPRHSMNFLPMSGVLTPCAGHRFVGHTSRRICWHWVVIVNVHPVVTLSAISSAWRITN